MILDIEKDSLKITKVVDKKLKTLTQFYDGDSSDITNYKSTKLREVSFEYEVTV